MRLNEAWEDLTHICSFLALYPSNCTLDGSCLVRGLDCGLWWTRVPFSLVKTESPSGDPPLQGLLNCLKEIPEAQDRHPSPSGAGDLLLQEDPGALKRNSEGKGHLLSWGEGRRLPQAGL